MSRYMAGESEGSFWMGVLRIALGVFIGSLLAALAYTKIIAMGVEYAARDAAALLAKEMKSQAAKQDAIERVKADHARWQAADIEQQKRDKLRRDDELRVAWKQIYRPSAACQADPSTMPCVNAHAAAHKRFMEIYGEMPPRF
ncbi:hypothetical protein GCM10010975_26120 [Comamonas phosphati]|nr:hypothetical protein GCM10010975_26120 [Comamonas phosphati]